MLGNSETIENREWEARVSAGKGRGFAESDHHVSRHGAGGKVRTNVDTGKHGLSRDSIYSRKGKGRGKASRKI